MWTLSLFDAADECGCSWTARADSPSGHCWVRNPYLQGGGDRGLDGGLHGEGGVANGNAAAELAVDEELACRQRRHSIGQTTRDDEVTEVVDACNTSAVRICQK